MQKSKVKIDAIIRKTKKFFGSRVIATKDFLNPVRKFFFRLGFVFPRGSGKNLSVFLAGALVFLIVLLSLSKVEEKIKSTKQILGATSQSLEFLEQGNLTAAIQNLQVLEVQIQELGDMFTPAANALNYARIGIREFESLRITWDESANSLDRNFYETLKKSRAALVSARQELAKINVPFPTAFQEKYLFVNRILDDVIRLETFVLNLLGREPKTYLLIFQNNNEMRGTGGFIGSYGLLEFANGQVKTTKIESVYNLDGQLKEQILAPSPLRRQVTELWGMRDANWFADFPVSARKILGFLETEGGILADGVMAMTPDVFEKLLVLTGPVAMPEYGQNLTAENFREIAQWETSYNYDKDLNQPKKFLADFAPRFLAKLKVLSLEQQMRMLEIVFEMIRTKQLLVFSVESELQNTIEYFQADGRVRDTAGDYLAIYHSNVGGGKTDQKITQKVEKTMSVYSGGLATVKLKITRTHLGFEEKYFPKNLDFMRILVPAGARLLTASGFDDHELLSAGRGEAITDPEVFAWESAIRRDEINKMFVGREAGYAMFANWLELLPGESKTIELVYEIELGSSSGYTLLLQKQPGTIPFEFSLAVKYFPGEILYGYPEEASVSGQNYIIREMVDEDRFYGVVGSR